MLTIISEFEIHSLLIDDTKNWKMRQVLVILSEPDKMPWNNYGF